MEVTKNQPGEGARGKKFSPAAEASLIPLLFWSALGLLGLIYIIVIEWPPKEIPRTANAVREKLLWRQSGAAYIEAVGIAKGLVAWSPDTRWSHLVLDAGTFCRPLNLDVWYAAGTAEVPYGIHRTSRESWQLCFIAASKKPLFFKTGPPEDRDYKAAIEAARGL